MDFLKENNFVWGQALKNWSYQHGHCDHLYQTTQFQGRVPFIEDLEEKEHALKVMIRQLDDNPEEFINKRLKPESVQRVTIGRRDINYISGKKADKMIVPL
jgi:nitroimidazol reductase NimA-like FMN-containing flavoprotein (pyridoxamine 5'-phosphate oxidase superfamily)